MMASETSPRVAARDLLAAASLSHPVTALNSDTSASVYDGGGGPFLPPPRALGGMVRAPDWISPSVDSENNILSSWNILGHRHNRGRPIRVV